MSNEEILHIALGPAAFPLAVALLVYLSIGFRRRYFTNRLNIKQYKQDHPVGFWFEIVGGLAFAGLLASSGTMYLYNGKTILGYFGVEGKKRMTQKISFSNSSLHTGAQVNSSLTLCENP